MGKKTRLPQAHSSVWFPLTFWDLQGSVHISGPWPAIRTSSSRVGKQGGQLPHSSHVLAHVSTAIVVHGITTKRVVHLTGVGQTGGSFPLGLCAFPFIAFQCCFPFGRLLWHLCCPLTASRDWNATQPMRVGTDHLLSHLV